MSAENESSCAGAPDFKPALDSQFRMEEIADGVWDVYER